MFLFLSLITIVHGFYLASALYTLPTLFYLFIDASFLLKENRLKAYAGIHMLLLIFLLWHEPGRWFPWLAIGLMMVFLALRLNSMVNERQEQKELYSQLLGEYRKLKRLNLEREENVRIQERTMIARNIHDSVGHRLTALLMQLEMLSIQKKSTEYDGLKEMAKESLEEIRRAVKALQSEENEGISAVVQLIRKLEAESHLSVQFTIKQGILSVPLTNEKSIALYRVIQEGLTNAMRHAGTREVQVTLGKSAAGDIQFTVINRVAEPKPFTLGFGLKNMKSRLKEINGTLEAYQTEEQFVLTGTIPNEG